MPKNPRLKDKNFKHERQNPARASILEKKAKILAANDLDELKTAIVESLL